MRDDDARRRRFAAVVVPHLDAAYNLARWLTRDDQEAEDVVQTASLRALRFFDGFQGTNARAWLLAIVRNSFYSALAERRGQAASTPFDEEGYRGVILPVSGHGSLAVLAKDQSGDLAAVEKVAAQVRAAIEFTG